jgi:hypothetical protein
MSYETTQSISTFVILVKFRTLRTNLPLQGKRLGIRKTVF